MPATFNKVARREWRRVTRQLFALGLVTQLDRSALAAFSTRTAAGWKLRSRFRQFGLILKLAHELTRMQSPCLAILNTALEQFRTLSTEFGMPPTSHSRVKTANPKQRDLFQREVVKTVAEIQTPPPTPLAVRSAAAETHRETGRGWNAKHRRGVGPLRAYLCGPAVATKNSECGESLEFLLATGARTNPSASCS